MSKLDYTTNKLIITVGLPRSGKSTWSKEYNKKYGAPIINGDSIRLALHGVPFMQETEDLVNVFGLYMIKSLFHAGHKVVIADDCHVTKRSRLYLHRDMWQIIYKVFDTSKDECLMRAIDTKPFLIDVIKKMSYEFEPLTNEEQSLIISDDKFIID